MGAEDLDPDAYRSASDLRARLTEAGRSRAALDAAQKALQKAARPEEAEALEKASEFG